MKVLLPEICAPDAAVKVKVAVCNSSVVEVATSSTSKPVEPTGTIETLPASIIGASGSMVTVEAVGVCPATVSVTVRFPATVPGSSVGKGTLVLPAGTVILAVVGLDPKPVANPASPTPPAGNPESVVLNASESVPVNAVELAELTVTVAFVIPAPGA